VLISDYAKGVIGGASVRAILALAARHGKGVAVDPKVQHVPLFKGLRSSRPTITEASAAARIPIRTEADLRRVGRPCCAACGPGRS